MKPDRGESYLVNTRVLDHARVAEVYYPSGMRQDRHRHESASFSFVASGRYDERLGRREHSRTSATLIYHPAGEIHAVAFETDVRILSVEFRPEVASRSMTRGLESGSSHRSALVAWLGSRLQHEMTRVDDASSLAIEAIIAEMLAEGSRGRLLSEQKRAARWMARAIDFVNDNFTCALSLDQIARVAGVHPAHVSRVFRQKMGCTVGDYVRRLRFEYACQQILAKETPLSDIAQDAGFADQSHFNRIFRTKMGVTPYAYRKLHRR